MTTITLGIDISKDKLDVALWRDERYWLGQFVNEPVGFAKLTRWLEKRQGTHCHVCIEATGRYGEAVTFYLHEQGYSVSLVNPARIKAYGDSQLKRNKTDKEDAKVIAHFCATQKPALWTPPSPEARAVQALSRRIDSLKAMRTQESNRCQAGLADQTVLDDIAEHISYLNERIKILTEEVNALVNEYPQLRQQRDLLTSIPGISDITAIKFLAEIPDISQFESASQLAAYAGLTPRHHHSGSSIHKRGKMSKTGNGRFRTAFFLPAVSAMRWNPIVKALVERLEKKGKIKMVIVGAAMRKLVHLAYGVLKTGKPFDPNYLQNRQIGA